MPAADRSHPYRRPGARNSDGRPGCLRWAGSGGRRARRGVVAHVPGLTGRNPPGYCGGMAEGKQSLDIGGTTVVVSNPGKVYFPHTGHTKLDLVRYYLAVAGGALRGAGGRPNGAQAVRERRRRRAVLPEAGPGQAPGLDRDGAAQLPVRAHRRGGRRPRRGAPWPGWRTWAASTSTRTRCGPRTSTIPTSCGSTWTRCPAWHGRRSCDVALVARDVLTDFGLTGWPKTSGSRGFHIYARIEPRWGFTEVRRAAVALAREIERRAPDLATAQWWKEERHGVFVDYNQNAKDRTVASAYSVRPTRDARVSTPLAWAEVPGCDPAAFTLGHGARPVRRDRRPVGGHGRRRRARWSRCSPSRLSTRRPALPTRPGRRTMTSRPVSRPGSSRPSADGRAPRPGRWRRPHRASRAARPGGAGPRCRSSRWPAPPTKDEAMAGPGAVEAAAPGGLAATWSPRTCWWTRCAGAAPAGPGSG